MKWFVVGIIQYYQKVSRTPAVRGIVGEWAGCRFWPTCSDYAIVVIQQQGVVRGGIKALLRILRCNPFTPSFIHTHD